jgi:ubiquinone/menaquinone biosynthesis C-methylase UbiE
MDLDTYRRDSLETWAKMAPGWEDRREWLMGITGPVNAWLAEKSDPQPGQVFLDVAAGTGDLGFLVAERVGDQGRVISTDFSPEMVDVARRQGEARGVSNVDFRVLDAERMDLEDDSVDGVVCRYGYMLMADPAAAMAETRRVLRDGGPLAFAVWGTPDRNPWAAVPAMTLMQRGHLPPPEPGAPGIFALGEPERIRDLVGEAGFAQPQQLEELTLEFKWANFDDVWDALTRISGSLSSAILALPEDERAATRKAVEDNVASFRNDDGTYSAPASAWGVLAR